MKLAPHVFALMTLLLSGCSSAGPGGGKQGGETVQCAGEARVTLDCSSEIDYQGAKGEASLDVMSIGGASGKFEETALRRVSEQIQQFTAMHTRACRDYNACVLSAEQYRSESADIRKRLTTIPVLLEALKSAKSEAERMRALDALYRGIVPEEKRVEEIAFDMGMIAEAGGDDRCMGCTREVYTVSQGDAVPTGARVVFTVAASKKAYVYMFQTTPTGEVSVLFPDMRIGTRNPLPAGVPTRIPSGTGMFRVNDKDIGTERVYFVVSQKSVPDLEAALDKVKQGSITTVAQNQVLRQVAGAPPPAAQDNCAKTRGLTLDSGSGAPCLVRRGLEYDAQGEAPSRHVAAAPPVAAAPQTPSAPSISVVTAPGDDTILRVFEFEHVPKAQWRGVPKDGTRKRGIVIEE
jgi:hypothetical protein